MNQPFGKKEFFHVEYQRLGCSKPSSGGLCPQKIPNDEVVCLCKLMAERRRVDGLPLLICHFLTGI